MRLFYPIIIVLGVLASYTDIKLGKIKNKHLFFAIIAGLAVYTYLIINQRPALGTNLSSNLLLGIGVGLILYFTDIWGAGDAKLFAVFCLLMPTGKSSHIIPFASLAIFINTFLLSTIVMLFISINHILKTKTQIFKEIFSLSVLERLWATFLIIISLVWIVPPLVQHLLPEITFFLHIMIMYFVYHALFALIFRYIPTRRLGYALFGIGLLTRLYFQPFDFIGISMLVTLKRTVFYGFAFSCMRVILEKNKPNDKNEERMPFAPIIFLGTLLSNTNFLNSILHILRTLKQ